MRIEDMTVAEVLRYVDPQTPTERALLKLVGEQDQAIVDLKEGVTGFKESLQKAIDEIDRVEEESADRDKEINRLKALLDKHNVEYE